MSFYFPIKINNRRLHVLHLHEEGTDRSDSCLWSFIINVDKSKLLLNFDKAAQPKLIARDGKHKELTGKWTFVVLSAAKGQGDTDVYRVRLTNDEKVKKEHKKELGLCVTGKLADDVNPLLLAVDTTIVPMTRPITLQIEFEDNGVLYTDSVKMYFSEGPRDRIGAAMDFGSEASQVRLEEAGQNLHLVSIFEDILKIGSSSRSEYWQGESYDRLFKSVFWIRREPVIAARYGAYPAKSEDKPFVSPLLSASTLSGTYKELDLLPNLKLVELSNKTLTSEDIKLPNGSNIKYRSLNLSDRTMRDSVLRLILSNFLHAILTKINDHPDERCLRLVVMAPNVYYQNKVFDMMKGLYQDFEIIKKSGAYPKCKGIEVQVVSESDAAFIGARTLPNTYVPHASNGYFLNIDSGKGTTDFSILQQKSDLSKFSSLYRDGLPAAGNVITYAYYEALYDFMKVHGIDIQLFLKNSEKSALIKFMTCLERLKKQDAEGYITNTFTPPTAAEINYINDINKLLSYIQDKNKGRAIPNVSVYVEKKLTELVGCLKESINHYMKMNPCVFTRVILSGRALLFQPYMKMLRKMLLDQGWIKSEEHVICVGNDDAKMCCLDGALQMEASCDVNFNSGLIGSPLLLKTEDENEGAIAKLWAKVLNFFSKKRYSGLNIDFFYDGSAGLSTRNVTLRLGGRVHELPSGELEEKKIYFLGDTFASQVGEQPLKDINSNELHYKKAVYETLVSQSMFPYYKEDKDEERVDKPRNEYFDAEAAKSMKAASTPQAKPVTTSGGSTTENGKTTEIGKPKSTDVDA